MVYSESRLETLENGLRVAMLPVQNTRLIHCGLMINAGSRDEEEQNNGVAHLIEHTVFKGTKNRKAYHILNRMESVGGELNAFTSREKTCYFVSCLREHAGRAIELLSDITFNATFPEKEIDKEKGVIMEEFEMYQDSPEDSIVDEFLSRLFPGHPLGFDILGTPDSLKRLGREDILSFLGQNYAPGNMVLTMTGNVPANRMKYYAGKYFDRELPANSPAKREAPPVIEPFDYAVPKDFMQQHAMIGGKAPARTDDKRFPMLLINNILGGSGMSARLNMEIREKRGYTYNLWSHYSPFQDTGIFSVYLGTEQAYLDKSIKLTFKEFKKLRDKPLSDQALRTAKKQMKANIAMMQENYAVIMQSMAKNLLDYDHIIPLDTFFEKLDAVTKQDIMETAAEYLDPEKVNILKYVK